MAFEQHENRHQPLFTSWHMRELAGQMLLETSRPGAVILDQVAMWPTGPGMLRLVAIDPAVAVDERSGQDWPWRILGQLAKGQDARQTLEDLNTQIRKGGYGRGSGYASYCVVVADWNWQTESLKVVGAGDSVCWVRSENLWRKLGPSDMLSEKARARWTQHAPSQGDRQAHTEAHDELLGRPEDWNSAPLGQLPHLKVYEDTATAVTAVGLSTDGLDANAETWNDLEGAWRRVHERQAGWPHPQPHGDLAAVVARKKPAG